MKRKAAPVWVVALVTILVFAFEIAYLSLGKIAYLAANGWPAGY